MVDGHERFAQRGGNAFAGIETNQQRTGKTGAMRRRYRIHVSVPAPGTLKRFRDDSIHAAEVITGRQFRYDATVRPVKLDLGANHVRQDSRAIAHNGSRRFVAGRFDAEKFHRIAGSDFLDGSSPVTA
jgi:hypothetical protein